MADIRINALATTASSTASDDFLAVDGSANGTRKLNAYSPTFGGNLTVSGGTIGTAAATNLTLNGGSSGASLVLAQGSSDATALTANVSLYFQKAAASAIVFRNNAAGSYTEAMRIAGTTGNLLIGTTTDGGQKLQVSGTAYVSGDATFAGAVTINGKATFSYSGSNGPVINRTDGSGYLIFNKSNGVNGIQLSANANGELNFYTDDGVTYAGKISSSSASFVGAIAIGNTVQTAVSVASTHKVTISIGGTTYYLLATNV